MLRTVMKINSGTPRFSSFHYSYHYIEDIFLQYNWLLSDFGFYWPDGYLPDFLCEEGDLPINTHGGLVKNLMEGGHGGIVSSEFMFTFYKNLWGDWQDIIAIKKEETMSVSTEYLNQLRNQKMHEIDLERHPVIFANVDSSFWAVRSKNEFIENRLLEQYPKLSGIEWYQMEKATW